MPHRRGDFVLAYQWDYHCQRLFDSYKDRFNHIIRELGELQDNEPSDAEHLLYYFKKWHYNKELFYRTVNDIDTRVYTINSLGYRGYGVNIDLLNALGALKNDHYGHVKWLLEERFKKQVSTVEKFITLDEEHILSLNSNHIIVELCKILEWKPSDNVPAAHDNIHLDLSEYFHIMGDETPWAVNTAIFQKLFLHLGCSSNTIMKGTVGHEDTLPPRELKIIGNANFIAMYEETFAQLHNFTDVSLDLLKSIHLTLSKDLVPSAGDFRSCDFPDKNGVTTDFDNFDREVKDLGFVLWETGQSFHNLDLFIYNIARSYYMFIGIHPFLDSNGRVGKCFLNYMLMKKGLPPISFKTDDEVQCLPRYGGGMEDMYEYVKKRIVIAIEAYFYERWKLEHFGYLHKQIFNVSFDSGFYFRQIDDRPQRLEVHFIGYVANYGDPLLEELQDYCRVVLPGEQLLYNITIYCGFSKEIHGEWEHGFDLKHDFFVKEVATDIQGTRAFDVDYIIELYDYHYDYTYFNTCVASTEGGFVFNNKGLNYSYKIQR